MLDLSKIKAQNVRKDLKVHNTSTLYKYIYMFIYIWPNIL